LDAVLKAVDHLFEAQLDNGGWTQYYQLRVSTRVVADCVALSCQTIMEFEWATTLIFNTFPAITYTKC